MLEWLRAPLRRKSDEDLLTLACVLAATAVAAGVGAAWCVGLIEKGDWGLLASATVLAAGMVVVSVMHILVIGELGNRIAITPPRTE